MRFTYCELKSFQQLTWATWIHYPFIKFPHIVRWFSFTICCDCKNNKSLCCKFILFKKLDHFKFAYVVIFFQINNFCFYFVPLCFFGKFV